MRQTFLLRGNIFVCCLLPAMLQAGAQTLTQRHIAVTVNNPGFYEWLPEGYQAKGKQHWPLLFFFNGSGDFGNGDSSQLVYVLKNGPGRLMKEGQWPDSFTVKAQTFRFIVILPEYKAVPSLSDLDSLVGYALSHYNVDTGRVYMTGLSSGGNAVWYYASASEQRARRLAAIMPISAGRLWSGETGAQIMASANLAIFAAANQYDSTIPCTETVQAIGLINGIIPSIRPRALDTIYDATGHDAWTQTYDPAMDLHKGLNAYQWMLQYSRNPGDSTAPAEPPPPSQLSSFFATYVARQQEVALSWTATAGQNKPYYLVQRSDDGRTFAVIDTVRTGADPAAGHFYNDVDTHPPLGTNYYRIEQVDANDQVSFSGIRQVAVPAPPAAAAGLRISPNPSVSVLNLDLSDSSAGNVQVRIIDIQGRTLRTWVFQKQSRTWHRSIRIGDLEKGDYFIQVLDKDTLATKPFEKL
ncbi:MAG TPA: T9SS type A sorting domain-containing protein [Puia sp.]|nr:T9SS type A sorting domain-containing protein [Puia sp.]